MVDEKVGFYDRTTVIPEELQRLKGFDYPNSVSISLLEEIPSLKGRVLADIGAGPGSTLGKYVNERGGKYLAIDLNSQFLANIRTSFGEQGIPYLGIQTDTRSLGLADGSADFSHQRFVLMHLKEADQDMAVQEVLRVTQEQALLLEYNWQTLQSTEDGQVLERFKRLSSDLASRMNVDLYMGSKLEGLARKVAPHSKVSMRHYQREEGDYTNELLALCRASAGISNQRLHDEKLANGFEELGKELTVKPIRFTPPEIVAVLISAK